MPGRDKTGPNGAGPNTGRGCGGCGGGGCGSKRPPLRGGRGCRRPVPAKPKEKDSDGNSGD